MIPARFRSVALLAMLVSAPASAGDSFWFGARVGTLGLGGEVAWRPIEWFDLRAGVGIYDFDDQVTYGGVNYDGTLALDNYYLTGNLHFPISPFRLTVGAYQNNNEIRLASRDMAAYPIGNNPVPYSPAEVGTLRPVASFDGIAPYFGAGYDFGIAGRLSLSLDFGVLLQGEPSITIGADGQLANDPAFLADLDAEAAEIADEVDHFKTYPVVSLGMNFSFF